MFDRIIDASKMSVRSRRGRLTARVLTFLVLVQLGVGNSTASDFEMIRLDSKQLLRIQQVRTYLLNELSQSPEGRLIVKQIEETGYAGDVFGVMNWQPLREPEQMAGAILGVGVPGQLRADGGLASVFMCNPNGSFTCLGGNAGHFTFTSWGDGKMDDRTYIRNPRKFKLPQLAVISETCIYANPAGWRHFTVLPSSTTSPSLSKPILLELNRMVEGLAREGVAVDEIAGSTLTRLCYLFERASGKIHFPGRRVTALELEGATFSTVDIGDFKTAHAFNQPFTLVSGGAIDGNSTLFRQWYVLADRLHFITSTGKHVAALPNHKDAHSFFLDLSHDPTVGKLHFAHRHWEDYFDFIAATREGALAE